MNEISYNEKINGWVVVNPNHPRSGKQLVIASTFSRTRTEAIKSFVSGSGSPWEYWKRNWNFRCVKAESVLTVKF